MFSMPWETGFYVFIKDHSWHLSSGWDQTQGNWLKIQERKDKLFRVCYSASFVTKLSLGWLEFVLYLQVCLLKVIASARWTSPTVTVPFLHSNFSVLLLRPRGSEIRPGCFQTCFPYSYKFHYKTHFTCLQWTICVQWGWALLHCHKLTLIPLPTPSQDREGRLYHYLETKFISHF
jgi:hypothetical protein